MDTGKIKILLVEDDKLISAMYLAKFNQNGFDVVLKKNGIEALTVLRDGMQPDLILTDIMMPEMDGFEFVAKRNEEQLAVKSQIVALTNVSSYADEEKMRNLGVNDYVVKVLITPDGLVELVQGIINKQKNK